MKSKAKIENELYCLIDEKFISEFDDNQRNFMKNVYYKQYCAFVKKLKCKKLTRKEFFTNMSRRRIRLYQLCCPYCGTIDIIPADTRLKINMGHNYCHTCGRDSTVNVCISHINRFIRLSRIINAGLEPIIKEKKDKEWLIAYEAYQMELISLVSIIEVVFRDFFEALLFINNINIDSNMYIHKSIKKAMGNEFMNLEKANEQYKKAFNINLKSLIKEDIWNDLIDLVNLRNIYVHNNGYIDSTFKNTASYERLKSKIHSNLYQLEWNDLVKYFGSVYVATMIITDIYYKEYYRLRKITIANYYFNMH